MTLPTNSGSSILSAIPSLVQLFVGSGKQTGTKTSTSAKSTSSASTNALTSILGQAAPNTNAAVQNAIDLMFRDSMPSIGSAERRSGIFNSSATRENVNQVGATAAAKAAEIELAQQNKSTDQKIQAAGTLGQLTGTDTQTQSGTEQTGAAIDPLMAALSLGSLMIGNKLFKGFGSDSSAPAASNIDITPTMDKSKPFDFAAGISADSIIGDIAGGLKNATFDPVTGTNSRVGGGNDFLGVLSEVASSSLLSGIGDFFGGLFGGGSSSGSGSNDSNGKSGLVICTRMNQLGYLDGNTYMLDRIYGYYMQATNPKLVAWYHSWAIPFVANWLHGRTLASKVMIQLMRPVVAIWSVYMKRVITNVLKAGIQWQV